MAKVKVWYENPKGSPPAMGPYSHVGAITGGTMLFIAGQAGYGPDGKTSRDFATQFRQTFKNLGAVLKGLGCDFNSVAKFTTYLVHSQDTEILTAERKALFPKLFKGGLYPPNTTVIVDRLFKEEFLIEVEAIVGVP